MGKQGYNGRPSNKFKGGSNRHNGASISQSGQQQFGASPKPKRGNGGKGRNKSGSGGQSSLERMLFGKQTKKKNRGLFGL